MRHFAQNRMDIDKSRNFGLDLARSFSIILVLINHKVVLPIKLGLTGVQLFFVLSGFLIGQILIRDFQQGSDFKKILIFWKRRWFRTLPLYYFILSLRIFFTHNPLGWKVIVYYFFLQANFVGVKFFSISWSLVVEEWFYIFLPLGVFLFLAKGFGKKEFILFLIFFIFFFFISRFAWNYSRNGIIIYQFDCLLVGVLLAAIKVFWTNLYQKLDNAYLFFLGTVVIVILVLSLGNLREVSTFSVYHRVIWSLLISLTFALILPFLEQSFWVNRVLVKRKYLRKTVTLLSVLTYSIYLIHLDIFQTVFFESKWFNALAQSLLLLFFAILAFIFVEYPCMSLRDNFSWSQYKKSIRSAINFFERSFILK